MIYSVKIILDKLLKTFTQHSISIIKFTTILFGLLVFSYYTFAHIISQQQIYHDYLNLLLLIDASGSMKQTDPNNYRKLAAEAILHILPSTTKIAIVEFDTDGRILLDWSTLENKAAIVNKIYEVGNTGHFTDFSAGFETAIQLIDKAAKNCKKNILLLSDGMFEPNPYSNNYAPLNSQFSLDVIGKSSRDKFKIYQEKYRERLVAIAKRILDTEHIKKLQEENVEVFTVGFSHNADRDFLRYIADSTSKNNTEVHYFFTDKAVDLMNVFIGLLQYWKDFIIVYQKYGNITSNFSEDLFIDEFLQNIFFFALTQDSVDFCVQTKNGEAEDKYLANYPNFKIISIQRKNPPDIWNYSFNGPPGEYRLLVGGKSTLKLHISNLREKYLLSDTIQANVAVTVNNESAINLISNDSKIDVSIFFDDGFVDNVQLTQINGNYSFIYIPKRIGPIRILFTLNAKDIKGNELLPRPSLEYKLEVMPSFFIEPKYLDFGDLDYGDTREKVIFAYSGYDSTIDINVTSELKNSSRTALMKEQEPLIKSFNFSLNPGERKELKITLIIPDNGTWGDFEGTINFRSSKGINYEIGYRVHVPSLFEKLTLPILIVIVILTLGIIFLAIVLGFLKRPVGVLRPIQCPSEEVLHDIELSKVKKGFFYRWVNFKKNRILISKNGEIKLHHLPEGLNIELIFYRFGRDYIKNVSKLDSGKIIGLQIPDNDMYIERGPQESYYLTHGLIIKIENYEFQYQNI